MIYSMKFKKNIINILQSQDILSEFNQKIVEDDFTNDIWGFHNIINNKIDKIVDCVFTMESGTMLFWSIDRKKTTKTCIESDEKTQICKVEIRPNQEVELFIWTEEKSEITLKTIRNIVRVVDKLDTLFLTDPENDSFEEIFGFRKRFHFDNYRFLLIKHLCSLDADDFIKEMIDKIIKHAKVERVVESNTPLFFSNVFQNIIQENCGMNDPFRDYREKILNHLRLSQKERVSANIITDRNVIKSAEEDKPIRLNIAHDVSIFKKGAYKTIMGDVFFVVEYNKKEVYFEPTYSIVLFNAVNDIEPTIRSIIETERSNYEVLIYTESMAYISNIEKYIKKYMFKNQFKIKFVIPQKVHPFSEIQKMLILARISCSLHDYIFFCGAGCIFPKNYIRFIDEKQLADPTKMYIVSECNMLNRANGSITQYVANHNRLYHYYIECLFPILHRSIIEKINYQSPLLGKLQKFKEFKNFLMKNGTIQEIEIITTIRTKDALHIFEG